MTTPMPPANSIPGAEGFNPDARPTTGDPKVDAILGGNDGGVGGDADTYFTGMTGDAAGLVIRNGGMFDTEKKGQKDPELKIKDVMWRFYRWSDEQVRALARKLSQAGFDVTENSSRDEVWKGLFSLLMETASRTQAMGLDRAPTVDQVLQGYLKNPVGDAAEKRPESYTQTSTSLTDPSSAKALLDRVLAKELGRDPTAAEKAAFLSALNTAERQNPVKTTQRLDKSTGMYLTSETAGGIDPEEFAAQWVEDDDTRAKERGDYQMATTYFDALLSAIQSPVG